MSKSEKIYQKYCLLVDFIEKLPIIRRDVDYYVNNFKHKKDSIISSVILLMEYCSFRVGKDEYKRSSGTTTLRNKHLLYDSSDSLTIKFKGKKQVTNECLANRKIKDILDRLYKRTCEDCFVFMYKNKKNKLRKITYKDVNEFLQRYGDFSSKFFRTLTANTLFIYYMQNNRVSGSDSIQLKKKNLSNSITYVSKNLYHTKGICKKNYLDPKLLNMYSKDTSTFYNMINNSRKDKGLSNEETIYLGFLYTVCI